MPAPPRGPVPRIVVGVDGSPSSQEALRWAVRQAGLTGGTVDAVMAWEFPSAIGGYGWAPAAMIEDWDFAEIASKTLDDAIGNVVDANSGVSVRPLVVAGNPAQTLLDAAVGADLLVVGSRGHGGFASALLGSVSQHCVHYAAGPVAVIRVDRHS